MKTPGVFANASYAARAKTTRAQTELKRAPPRRACPPVIGGVGFGGGFGFGFGTGAGAGDVTLALAAHVGMALFAYGMSSVMVLVTSREILVSTPVREFNPPGGEHDVFENCCKSKHENRSILG